MDWKAASPEDRFKEAERRIEEVHLSGATWLDLGDLGLSELPESLGRLVKLQELVLGSRRPNAEGELDWNFGCPDSGLADLGPILSLRNLVSLALSHCCALAAGLTPLARLKNLQELYIDSCTSLTGDLAPLGKLKNLKALRLYDCPSLTGNFTPLGKLKNLQSLDLDSCTSLTGDLAPLAKLKNLQSLHIYSCALDGDLKPLAKLKTLQSFQLNDCPALTGDFAPLAELQDLQILSLISCPALAGDLAPLARLKRLQSLELYSCPALAGNLASLANLRNLKLLKLCDCPFLEGDVAPLAKLQKLKSLHLAYCPALAEVLKTFAWFKSLKHLGIFRSGKLTLELVRQILAKNPQLEELICDAIEGVPEEILSEQPDDNRLPLLRSFLVDLEMGEVAETDVKLFLLGNGRVGKTQLCRRLRDEPFEADSASTHGVKLWRQKIQPGPGAAESIYYANWWDFGGQDIYHSTHSLFLRSRAVFLILWTPDLENCDEYEESGIPMRNQPLAYWLDYVRSLAGDESPILVVQSKCENVSVERDPPACAKGFQFVRYCHFGAKNDHGRDGLMCNLREAIHCLGEDNGALVIGTGRAELRRRLYELRDRYQCRPEPERQHRTLNQPEFVALCKEVGGISSPEHALDYFHQTGAVFYQIGLFGDLIVLDQSWALDAVYSVFNRARTMPSLRENGRFTRQDLQLLCWEGKSREEQELFLAIMRFCGICFIHQYVNEDKEPIYLAPDLLPEYEEVKPRLWAWEANHTIATLLRLEYRFLHRGLLLALIHAVGVGVKDHAEYWKYGVWLRTRRSGSQLLVQQEDLASAATPGAGAVLIAAQGPETLQLIAQVHKSLLSQRLTLETPKEYLTLAGATVAREALDYAMGGKVLSLDGQPVAAQPFAAFWNLNQKDLYEKPDSSKLNIDAAPLERRPLKVFFSYSLKDDDYRTQLARHLAPLEFDLLIETWHAGVMEPGVEWDEAIRLKLYEADIILLLVSSDFLASSYIREKELAPALERHKNEHTRVIPIILRECDWKTAPFSHLQPLPQPADPISTWSDRDAAYTMISRALRELSAKLR